MNAWLNNTLVDIRLTFRDRQAIFWNYAFPLFFLFLFSSIFARGNPKAVAMLLPGLLCISMMSAGLFGMSIGLVSDRERGILRRYQLAPIHPLVIISSQIISGFVVVLSTIVLQLVLARMIYKLEIAGSLWSLAVMAGAGALAFLSIGFVIASVAENAKSAQVMSNLLFFPLMFLGGAAFPIQFLPPAIRKLSLLLPSRYLTEGLGRVINDGAGVSGNLPNLAVMASTFVVALIVAAKIFRWDSREPLSAAKKAWVAAIALVFVIAALWART
ncbi:MAG TPA: ABC transporter permease [Blastocatellia bacterium]|nr:ABC transporter permease [Blastocatellia bacterium]